MPQSPSKTSLKSKNSTGGKNSPQGSKGLSRQASDVKDNIESQRPSPLLKDGVPDRNQTKSTIKKSPTIKKGGKSGADSGSHSPRRKPPANAKVASSKDNDEKSVSDNSNITRAGAAQKLAREEERKKKGLVAGDFKGLANEYPSFDLLWFDIESKSRHLMQDLIDPVIDRLVE